jgi:hypothetical protein
MKKHTALAAMLVLLLASALPAFSQQPGSGRVIGQVRDVQTGQPLAGASVTIESLEIRAMTDPRGNFVLNGVPAGQHMMTVRFLGYSSHHQRVNTASLEPVTIDLLVDAIQLEAITVQSNRLRGRRNSVPLRSRAISHTAIANSGGSAIDALRREGINIMPCGRDELCLSRRGSNYDAMICIDDRPAQGGLRQLAAYGPALHSMEVYDDGVMIRAYTQDFMERLSRGQVQLSPIYVMQLIC